MLYEVITDGQGFYLKSGDEMAEVFRDHPSAVANSLEVAERCNLVLRNNFV